MLHDPLRRGARNVHRAHPGREVRPAVVRDEYADCRHESLRDHIAVVLALVEVLRLRVAPEPLHRHHPEVVEDSAGDVLGDLEPEFDLEPERVELDDLERLEPRVRRASFQAYANALRSALGIIPKKERREQRQFQKK